MRAVIQRVAEAQVKIDGQIVGKIGRGLLILFGVQKNDAPDKTAWLAQKLVNLRIFPDSQDKMNRSLLDIQGQALIVSQFTLYGDCSKGRRPEFTEAAPPDIAEPLYQQFISDMKSLIKTVQNGQFGAMMEVSLINDGPVTLILDH
jgi:D-aminoacyl-tRNA deacylase